jgi:hypothetical protein
MTPKEEREARPWERKGQVRRDAEPHRGVLLDVFETTRVLCGIIMLFLLIPT